MNRRVMVWLVAGLLAAAQAEPAFALSPPPAGLTAPSGLSLASGYRDWGRGRGHWGGHYRQRAHDGAWIGLGVGLLLGTMLAPPVTYYYRPYYVAPPPRRPCHPVVRDSFDRYGRPLRLGATMCYRYDGRAYILPGSRHVVGYY